MNGYIIFGISKGLGKEIYEDLSKNNIVIGLTSGEDQFDNNIIHYSLSNEFNETNTDLKNILKLINKYKNYKFTIIFNSAIYDQVDDTISDKKKILDINFFNQIELCNFLEKKIKLNISKLIFFSSFEALKKFSKLEYYRLSKILFISEYFKRLNSKKSIQIKLFILGGIKTETYNKNSRSNKNFILKLIPKNLIEAKNFIIKKINTNGSEIIYYPKIYYYLNIMYNLLKK